MSYSTTLMGASSTSSTIESTESTTLYSGVLSLQDSKKNRGLSKLTCLVFTMQSAKDGSTMNLILRFRFLSRKRLKNSVVTPTGHHLGFQMSHTWLNVGSGSADTDTRFTVYLSSRRVQALLEKQTYIHEEDASIVQEQKQEQNYSSLQEQMKLIAKPKPKTKKIGRPSKKPQMAQDKDSTAADSGDRQETESKTKTHNYQHMGLFTLNGESSNFIKFNKEDELSLHLPRMDKSLLLNYNQKETSINDRFTSLILCEYAYQVVLKATGPGASKYAYTCTNVFLVEMESTISKKKKKKATAVGVKERHKHKYQPQDAQNDDNQGSDSPSSSPSSSHSSSSSCTSGISGTAGNCSSMILTNDPNLFCNTKLDHRLLLIASSHGLETKSDSTINFFHTKKSLTKITIENFYFQGTCKLEPKLDFTAKVRTQEPLPDPSLLSMQVQAPHLHLRAPPKLRTLTLIDMHPQSQIMSHSHDQNVKNSGGEGEGEVEVEPKETLMYCQDYEMHIPIRELSILNVHLIVQKSLRMMLRSTTTPTTSALTLSTFNPKSKCYILYDRSYDVEARREQQQRRQLKKKSINRCEKKYKQKKGTKTKDSEAEESRKKKEQKAETLQEAESLQKAGTLTESENKNENKNEKKISKEKVSHKKKAASTAASKPGSKTASASATTSKKQSKVVTSKELEQKKARHLRRVRRKRNLRIEKESDESYTESDESNNDTNDTSDDDNGRGADSDGDGESDDEKSKYSKYMTGCIDRTGRQALGLGLRRNKYRSVRNDNKEPKPSHIASHIASHIDSTSGVSDVSSDVSNDVSTDVSSVSVSSTVSRKRKRSSSGDSDDNHDHNSQQKIDELVKALHDGNEDYAAQQSLKGSLKRKRNESNLDAAVNDDDNGGDVSINVDIKRPGSAFKIPDSVFKKAKLSSLTSTNSLTATMYSSYSSSTLSSPTSSSPSVPSSSPSVTSTTSIPCFTPFLPLPPLPPLPPLLPLVPSPASITSTLSLPPLSSFDPFDLATFNNESCFFIQDSSQFIQRKNQDLSASSISVGNTLVDIVGDTSMDTVSIVEGDMSIFSTEADFGLVDRLRAGDLINESAFVDSLFA